MFKKFEKCIATKLLSILLLTDVSIGAGLAVYEGQILWGLSFIAALLTGMIGLISVTEEDRKS